MASRISEMDVEEGYGAVSAVDRPAGESACCLAVCQTVDASTECAVCACVSADMCARWSLYV